jgi:hypothetical protein
MYRPTDEQIPLLFKSAWDGHHLAGCAICPAVPGVERDRDTGLCLDCWRIWRIAVIGSTAELARLREDNAEMLELLRHWSQAINRDSPDILQETAALLERLK